MTINEKALEAAIARHQGSTFGNTKEAVREYIEAYLNAIEPVGDDEILSVIAECQANGWDYGTHPREKAKIVLDALRSRGIIGGKV
jgi:hypothetical protein